MPMRETTVEDAATLLAYSHSVVVVPGYGLAVAQAQQTVRELAEQLEKRGVEVRYAIHPVAGRMPGHMNVLLAEANIPYTQLKEMDDINPDFPQTDVALVIGANDVTNPAARTDPSSPILRHAHPQRRRGAQHHRHQAWSRRGLRRHRERPLREPQDHDALRRREGRPHTTRQRDESGLAATRRSRARP